MQRETWLHEDLTWGISAGNVKEGSTAESSRGEAEFLALDPCLVNQRDERIQVFKVSSRCDCDSKMPGCVLGRDGTQG